MYVPLSVTAMAKEYQFNWRTKVPEALLKGAYFDRYDDVRHWNLRQFRHC